MSIVIFSGTTEGRNLSEYLCNHRILHEVCVATQSGESVMSDSAYAHIHVGRLDRVAMRTFLMSKQAHLVVDATHPYAKDVTDNLKVVCDELNLEYIRINRQSCLENTKDLLVAHYEDATSLAQALVNESGNILLTTGSKDLSCYMDYPKLLNRLYVRVLPSIESLELCSKATIPEQHVIAMYGPHTSEMNVAVMQQYNIKHLVTKESGMAGGFIEKLDAAAKLGVKVHIIERPGNKEGISLEEAIERFNEVCGINGSHPKLRVKLIGIGPGSVGLMTQEAIETINRADYCFGAKRMLESCKMQGEKITEYMPDKVIESLESIMDKSDRAVINAAVLFSGDTGIFSGATKLYEKLVAWGRCDELTIFPGISSFSAFSAAVGVDYTGAFLESLHGKSEDLDNRARIASLIKAKNRVFVLMSGKADFDILNELIPSDFNGELVIGRNVAYDDQLIIKTDIVNFKKDIEDIADGLFVVLVNPKKVVDE